MNLNKYLPLTETTFYVLLALLEPGHGYVVMTKVEELSKGSVRIAAGTIYGIIENLLTLKMIKSVPSTDKRRKIYQTTSDGLEVMALEIDRLTKLTALAVKMKEAIK